MAWKRHNGRRGCQARAELGRCRAAWLQAWFEEAFAVFLLEQQKKVIRGWLKVDWAKELRRVSEVAQAAADRGQLRVVYESVRSLGRRRSTALRSVTFPDGSAATSEQEVAGAWLRVFAEQLGWARLQRGWPSQPHSQGVFQGLAAASQTIVGGGGFAYSDGRAPSEGCGLTIAFVEGFVAPGGSQRQVSMRLVCRRRCGLSQPAA